MKMMFFHIMDKHSQMEHFMVLDKSLLHKIIKFISLKVNLKMDNPMVIVENF